MRLIKRNSSTITNHMHHNELKTNIVLLPINNKKLTIQPIMHNKILYISTNAQRTQQPATIKQITATPLIFYDTKSTNKNPIHHQLTKHTQTLNLQLQPKIKIKLKNIALQLITAKIGNTYLPNAFTRTPYYPNGLNTTSFNPALYNTFTIISHQNARISPNVHMLVHKLETHMHTVTNAL